MSTLAIEKTAALSTTPITSYDQDKWNLGSLIQKRTDLGVPFIGPMIAPVYRPFEGLGIGGNFIHVVPFSSTVDWVFWGDVAAAAVTRRIMFALFDRATCQWGTAGYITLTLPPATAHTIRGYRMTLDQYTTGLASCSGGTAVTGSGGSLWLASGLAVGSRIGFGSTNPSAITTWYEIGAVSSDTAITLTGNGPSTGGAVAYVIEELRCVISTTNATTTNGGLFAAKGLRIELFTAGGTTIPAATTVDNIRAVYWLADAATVLNTVACGCAIKDRDSWTQHYAYVMDALTPTRVFKYNVRAALAGLAVGKSTSAWVLTTGTVAVTGTNSQVNNGRMATAGHGPGSGVLSLYFITTTRVYRAAESGIVSASTTWISDAMTEVPPGGTSTFALTAAIAGIEYASTIDRLIVTSSGAAGVRSYITQFRTDGGQFDHIFLVDDKQIDQANKDSDAPDHPSLLASAVTVYTESGLCYVLHPGTTALLSFIHVVPVGAHWSYAASTQQRLIAPRMATLGAEGFSRGTWYAPEMIGGVTLDALGISIDPVRAYYRITGISDNSGAWTLIGADGSLAGVGAADEIQLMIEFRCITQVCIPSRIFAVGVSYVDGGINDPHYRQSVRWSDRTAKQFAFRFVAAFGSIVPTLRIRIYDDVSGSLLVEDDSASPTGTWEKSTNDGADWGAYDTVDKANETTYVRYTPSSMADNVKARSRMTLL